MKDIIFDIETGPLPLPQIKQFMPRFSPPSNWKDKDKIAAYMKAKESEWVKEAALSATTGYIIAIGCYVDGEFHAFASGDERADLEDFWKFITYNGLVTNRLIGFNSNGFDIPFLVRRSWRCGVQVPLSLIQGKWLNKNCIDIMDHWKAGTRDSISLDNLSKFLGVGEKSGSGADFAKTWNDDPEAAIDT